MHTIWLFAGGLATYGGLEERVVSLSIALQRRGFDVSVMSAMPVASNNQYRIRLKAAGVRCLAPPRAVTTLAGDWSTRAQLIEAIVAGISPLLLGIAALLVLLRRQSLADAWSSTVGRARTCLAWLVLLNVLEWSFGILLAVQAVWHGPPDLVHVHGYRFDSWRRLRWARRRGIPTIYEEHSSPSSAFPYPADPFTAALQPHALITVSAESATHLSRYFGPRTEVIRVPPIVDACDPEPRNPHRTEMCAPVITCAARLIPEKGLVYLLEAMAELLAALPSLRLDVYGDGPLMPTLVTRAAELAVDRAVSFHGPYQRIELANIMRRTDVFVLPSVTEGLPLTLLEAMAWGLPIVASRVGGIPDIVEDGATGLLVPPCDARALAQALMWLLEDQARRERLGRAARAAYQSSGFTPQAVVDQMLVIYSQAVRAATGSTGEFVRAPRCHANS